MNEKTAKRRGAASGRAHQIPLWEWLIAMLGAVILLGAIAFFVVQAMNPPRAPKLTLTTDSIVQSGSHYLVLFHVVNEGRTVAGVVVEAVLEQAGTPVDRAEVLIPFAPTKSKADGTLVFQRDPRGAAMRIAVRGFTDP